MTSSVPGEDAPVEDSAAVEALAEAVADVQRVAAEYANFRSQSSQRVEKARQAGRRAVVWALLPLLDDVRRASEHEELSGAAAVFAESLGRVCANLKLEAFGSSGDVFDPALHEAVAFTSSYLVQVAEVLEVWEVGYRCDGVVVRPARVMVEGPV